MVALCSILAVSIAASAQDPGVALRERFLGPDGLPSEAAYSQANRIHPGSDESFDWRVIFRLAYRTADLARLNDAQAIHTDCYLIRTRQFAAPNRAQPVWDGRVYQANGRLEVAAYTARCERIFGHVDEHSRVVRSADAIDSAALPDLDGVQYNPFTGQLWRRAPGGKIEEEQRFYLPVSLFNSRGEHVDPEFKVVQSVANSFALVAGSSDKNVTLATCTVKSSDGAKRMRGYQPELGPGCTMVSNEPMTVVEISGEIATDVVDARGPQLVLRKDLPSRPVTRPTVQIDGRFEEWRSLSGITDPVGDVVSYLQYNSDTDLLEFKVVNDEEYLYYYTRVVGQHGNTAKGRDRYYFYVYIDADRNPSTGYMPTRDDDCYYGVTLGDDCEAQFEFVGGRFVKTFFGFAGRSTEKDVLSGKVTLAPSWYNRYDDQKRLRDGYKVEYIRRAGEISITEDLSEGTSDDITVAISPDGSECEMRAAMSGFLRNTDGKPIIATGQRIDLAAGVEASGQVRGNSKWGADSTVILRGYSIAK